MGKRFRTFTKKKLELVIPKEKEKKEKKESRQKPEPICTCGCSSDCNIIEYEICDSTHSVDYPFDISNMIIEFESPIFPVESMFQKCKDAYLENPKFPNITFFMHLLWHVQLLNLVLDKGLLTEKLFLFNKMCSNEPFSNHCIDPCFQGAELVSKVDPRFKREWKLDIVYPYCLECFHYWTNVCLGLPIFTSVKTTLDHVNQKRNKK